MPGGWARAAPASTSNAAVEQAMDVFGMTPSPPEELIVETIVT
jgi:hypothetical protein